MIHLHIYLTGKSREKWTQLAEQEYHKRLRPMARLEIHELRAQTLREDTDIDAVKEIETRALLDASIGCDLRIALDERGEQLSSEELAATLGKWTLKGVSRIAFLVGGASGLDPSLVSQADLVLSLSRMTFTHQMVRLFLVEQLYRALMIQAGRPYHR